MDVLADLLFEAGLIVVESLTAALWAIIRVLGE